MFNVEQTPTYYPSDLLVNNNQVLQYIVFWGPMVNIGIIATTFSGTLFFLSRSLSLSHV